MMIRFDKCIVWGVTYISKLTAVSLYVNTPKHRWLLQQWWWIHSQQMLSRRLLEHAQLIYHWRSKVARSAVTFTIYVRSDSKRLWENSLLIKWSGKYVKTLNIRDWCIQHVKCKTESSNSNINYNFKPHYVKAQ